MFSPSPWPYETFRNMVIFYGEEFLAPRPTPKLEDLPLPQSVSELVLAWRLNHAVAVIVIASCQRPSSGKMVWEILRVLDSYGVVPIKK